MTRHLAAFNFAKAVAPMEDPRLADFVAASPRINALAEAAPGFVWRYQADGVESFNIHPFEDPLIYTTLSVWESVEALNAFVFQSGHRPVMDRRNKWFTPLEPHVVLWWIEKGHRPTLLEAKHKLENLRGNGPSLDAFDFSRVFVP